MFDGFVGAVIGGFEAAGGTVFGIGANVDSGRLRSASEAFLSSGAAHDEVMATRDRRYPDLRRLAGCVAGFVSVSGCSFRPAIGNSSSP